MTRTVKTALKTAGATAAVLAFTAGTAAAGGGCGWGKTAEVADAGPKAERQSHGQSAKAETPERSTPAERTQTARVPSEDGGSDTDK